MILAGIDIGTNTIRLLITEYYGEGKYRTIESDRHIARLGEGISSAGILKDEAVDRVISVLKGYAGKCSDLHVESINAVATSAVREADNGREFISRVKVETGIDVNVISGEEEARLTMLGVSSAIEISGHDVLMMDIGGGSTEFILVSKGNIVFRKSTNIGVVRFSERYIKSDPPLTKEIKLLEIAIVDHLEKEVSFIGLKDSGKSLASIEFIGTAGTVTSLAAIEQKMRVYDPEKINGYRISKGGIKNILNLLAGMTNEERINLPGVEEGREDLIVAGALVTYKVMEWFGFDEMTVSDSGLREGLVADLYNHLSVK